MTTLILLMKMNNTEENMMKNNKSLIMPMRTQDFKKKYNKFTQILSITPHHLQ